MAVNCRVGRGCFRLNKLGGKFIDIRKTLSDLATMRTIWRWVCEKGYATQGSFYQVEHYDSELGWLHTPFLDRQRAVDEYESLAYEDDQVHLREIEGFLPTHTLREWALWDELPLTCCADFAVLSFGAHCSSLDGGVWQYPSSGVAAPVVGIFPHRVGDWTINIEEY